MSEKTSSDMAVTIGASVIVGAVIIAGSILWASGRFGGGSADINTPTAPAAAGSQGIDMTKIDTSDNPYIGNANAPITIDYWFDYQCPFCKQNEQTVMPSLISDYVNSGKARIVFHDFPFLGNDSMTLAVAARAVWAVDPNNFYAWHKAMFDAQGEENSGWATPSEIMNVTTSVLGASVAAEVQNLITTKGSTYQSEITADKNQGAAVGVNGTPAMVIGSGTNGTLIIGAVPLSNIESTITTVLSK